MSASDEIKVEMVLRLRVPDAHSDCPLGEKYGAVEEACGALVGHTLVIVSNYSHFPNFPNFPVFNFKFSIFNFLVVVRTAVCTRLAT